MKGINGKLALVIGGVILSLGVIYFVAAYAVPRVLVTMTKAAPAVKVSFTQSKIIGGKILAAADGEDKCRVNVFVMDESGRAVVGKAVALSGMETIEPSSGVSNASGLVSFEMTSKEAGQFELMATVEGLPLPKGVRVTFR